MAKETGAILRSCLYSVKKAKTLDEARRAIEVMCDGEDVALVAKMIADEKESQ